METIITNKHDETTIETTLDYARISQLTLEVTDLMKKEVELLKQMKIRELKTLNEEKLRITKELEDYKNLIVSDPCLIKSLKEEQQKELKINSLKLASVLNEDRKQLIKVKNAHQRLYEIIRNAVKEEAENSKSYNSKGEISPCYLKDRYMPHTTLNKNI